MATLCAPGWIALAGACYQFTTSLVSHAGCVETCRLSEATPACITSDEEMNFLTTSAQATGQGDVWTGHYLINTTSSNSGQVACVSGEEIESSFAPWAPTQPNAASEHCIALWSEFTFRWRDVDCSFAARCLCERSATKPSSQTSAEYFAFSAAEHIFYEEQLSIAHRWLLLVYLLLVPALSLLTLLCVYLFSRRARPIFIRSVATRRSDSNTTIGDIGLPESNSKAEQKVQPVMSLPSAPDVLVIENLRRSEQVAQRLWGRTSGFLVITGVVTFWLVVAPMGLSYVSIGTYRAIKIVVGSSLDIISSFVPWSLGLFALAVRPIDGAGVTRACNALFLLYFLVVIYMAGNIVFQPAYTKGLGAVLAWLLLVSYIVLGLLLWPMTSCNHRWRVITPREQLQRFWICLRGGAMIYSAFSLLEALKPLLMGYSLVFTGSHDIKISYLVAVGSFAGAGTLLNPSVRGAFQAWLVSRFRATRDESREQEASMITALLQGTSAADAYIAAKKIFRGLSIYKIPKEAWVFAHTTEYYVREQKRDRHALRSPSEALRDETEPVELGEVDAFVSYSWRDDSAATLAQLQSWAEDQPVADHGRRPTMVWIDRYCIDINDLTLSIACLPIHIAGCKRILVLAGSTYPSRLWCALELFVFVRMGGNKDDIELRLVLPPSEDETARAAEKASILTSMAKFDTVKAKCQVKADRQRILAVIEASFGTTLPFSKKVRSIFADKLQLQDHGASP